MVVYSDLENKEKELKQALELADSLDERKALRLELREVRKLLFETPKTNDVSKPIETKKQVTTTDINNNNTMTLNSQDSFDAPSVSKTAAERAARRARRAQHMKSLVNDSSSLIIAADTVSSQQTKTEQKVEPEVIQPKIEVKQQLSVGVTDHSSANSQAPKMPKFNANSSPGLRRTATWSPKDRVASKNVTTNAFSANKAKFGSQESSNKDASANRLSLQDRTPNRFQSTRDASPGRFEPNRDKSPGRFDINRDKSPNRFDINRNKIGSVRDKSPSPFDRTQQDRPKSHIGVAGMKGISGSASNRMSMFKEAEEKQAREIEMKKKRDEERKKNAEVIAAKAAEDAKRRAEEDERRKVEAEKKKAEEEERRKKEEEEKAKNKENEPAGEEVKDSEKMKYAAPCMRKREKKKVVRRTMSISSIVLDWVQEMIKDYPVEVTNFSSSWNNGMAFCALIHHFNPDEFDYYELNPENKRHNFDLAFNTGLKCKNIPILLDTEDMVRMKKPEPRSVQCYIQWIWSVYGPTSGYGPTPKEVQTASLN